MYNQTDLENNLKAIANHGDHYKFTMALNTLGQNDFQNISAYAYDAILCDLLNDHAQKGEHAVYSAIYVFFTVTKQFLPTKTKERTRNKLQEFFGTDSL